MCLLRAVAYVLRVCVCCGQLVCLMPAISVLDAGSWCICCGQLVCLMRAVGVLDAGSWRAFCGQLVYLLRAVADVLRVCV